MASNANAGMIMQLANFATFPLSDKRSRSGSRPRLRDPNFRQSSSNKVVSLLHRMIVEFAGKVKEKPITRRI